MNAGKYFAKTTVAKSLIRVVIILVAALALLLAALFVLKGRQDESPNPQGTPESTSNVTEDTGSGLPAESTGAVETLPTEATDAAETEPADSEPTQPEPSETKPAETRPSGTKPSETRPAETDPTEPEPTGSRPEHRPSGPRPKVTTYTVIFKDYDGTVLKTQKVEKGHAATAPADPSREHYTFAGWDKSFRKVTSNLVVTATYTTTETVISVESVTVNKSADEVKVNIRILNNPGIMGAVLKVSVDDKVFALHSGAKTGYPGLTLTTSGPGITASPYIFMLDALELSEDDKKDGTLFTVTFKIKDTAAAGNYQVTLSCDDGAIINEDCESLEAVLENGVITIK